MLNWYRALFLFDPPMPAAGALKPRILVLWGDRDDFGLPQLADESVALCADARLQHWPQATHWIIHDEPKAVQDALLDFMRAQPSRDVR